MATVGMYCQARHGVDHISLNKWVILQQMPKADCSNYITLVPPERHGASNNRQIDCLFNDLFRLASMKESKASYC